MTPYVIILALLTLASLYAPKLNNRSKNGLYIAIGIMLILFIIMRDYTVNKDFCVYETIYRKIPSFELLKSNFTEYFKIIKTELSYASLCSFLKSTGNTKETNFTIIFSLYAIVGVTIKLYSISKLTDLKFLTLFVYGCNLYLLHEMTQIRAGIAIGFILLSVYYLMQDKYWHYFACFLVAGLFHTSSFMTIVLLLFRKSKADFRIWGAIFLFCVFLRCINFDILNLIDFLPFDYYQFKLKAYIRLQNDEDFKINYFNVAFLIQNATIIACFFYKKFLERENPHINILLNMCCLSSCCFLFFGQLPGFAYRISEVFNCALMILIPTLSKVIRPKYIGELIIYLIGWLLFYINVFHSDLVYNYKTIWN